MNRKVIVKDISDEKDTLDVIALAPLALECPNAECNLARWRDFENQWARYKRCSGVGGQDIVDDLVRCLSDALRLEITSELGDSLEAITEEDLLAAIKRMAVLVSNPMVHRNQMRDHRQGESEKIRGFVARVRDAAIDCTFEVKCGDEFCGKIVSYKEEIIRDQCVFGLRCKDTQAKILALARGCQRWTLLLQRLRLRNRLSWHRAR